MKDYCVPIGLRPCVTAFYLGQEKLLIQRICGDFLEGMDCWSFALGCLTSLLKVSCIAPKICVKEKNISRNCIVIFCPLECLQVILRGHSQGSLHPYSLCV